MLSSTANYRHRILAFTSLFSIYFCKEQNLQYPAIWRGGGIRDLSNLFGLKIIFLEWKRTYKNNYVMELMTIETSLESSFNHRSGPWHIRELSRLVIDKEIPFNCFHSASMENVLTSQW